MATPPLDWTELTEHSRGLSRLAASLLSDFHGGEDLAQEAVLRALVAEPSSPHIRSGAAWLRVTVRRLAANEWRGRARRSQREKAVARPEAIPSSEDVIERAELSRKVLDALDGLPDLYARSLRDHFIGGLAAEQMAERDGVSIHTVRSRIQRGKAALRASLESAENSGGPHWSLTLAPLAIPVPGPALVSRTATLIATSNRLTPTLGVLTLMKKVALVAACIVAGFFGLKAITPSLAPSDGQTPMAAAEPVELDPSGSALQPRSVDADPRRTEAAVNATQTLGEAPHTTVTGSVVDSSQAPIEGVRVAWEGYVWIDRKKSLMRSATAITDMDGRYTVELPHQPDSTWRVEFRGSRFHTNASLTSIARDGADLPVLTPGELEAPTVTLGPAGAARGCLIDERGEPIADALVRLAPGKDGSSYGLLPEADTRSDVDGRFVLGHVALGALGVAISTEGRTTAYLPGIKFEHEVTMDLGDISLEKSKHITGAIVDEANDPVEGQRVRVWSLEEHNVNTLATTDALGRFDLILKSNAAQRLEIEREGYASIGGFGSEPVTVQPGVSDLRFQLEPMPSWTFRVVDADGDPIERFRLSLVLGGGSQSDRRVSRSGGVQSQPLHPGGVEIRHARAGQDLVRVRAEGYLPFESDVEPDLGVTEQQTVRLSKGAVLLGRVMRGDLPEEGATVTALGSRRHGRRTELTVQTDEEGRYVLRGLGPRGVSIAARSTDGSFTAAASLWIDRDRFIGPGQAPEVTVDDLQLQGRGSIEGTVSLPNGVEPEGLEVYVGDWGEAKRFPLRPDGSFNITDVEAGSHGVSLTERPGAIDKMPPVPVEVRESEVSFVQVDASQYGISRLDLTIEVPGYALEDVHVRVLHGLLDPVGHPNSRGGALPRCDSHGNVTLWPRASGIAHLELYLPDARTFTLLHPELTLTPGSVASLHVTVALGSIEVELPAGLDAMGPGQARLQLMGSGIPHPLSDWEIATREGRSSNFVRPKDGICILDPVQAGSFELRLEVRGPDFEIAHTHTLPVTVERGVTTRVAFPSPR